MWSRSSKSTTVSWPARAGRCQTCSRDTSSPATAVQTVTENSCERTTAQRMSASSMKFQKLDGNPNGPALDAAGRERMEKSILNLAVIHCTLMTARAECPRHSQETTRSIREKLTSQPQAAHQATHQRETSQKSKQKNPQHPHSIIRLGLRAALQMRYHQHHHQ